ncbi:MAG: penicillin-binding transpeptidase domain-containing protein [Nocardioidaceae bacterium]
MTRPRPPRPALLAVALAGLLAATGCSLFGGGPSAEDEAAAVAAALSAGKPATLSYVAATGAQAEALWTQATGGLGDSTPTVRAGRVTEADGGTATARLSWSWRLAGTSRRWTYRSSVALKRAADDSWQVRLAPTLVHPDLTTAERLVRSTSLPVRADILGAGGVRLVTARPVLRFGVDKTTVAPARQPAAARQLATGLGIDVPAYAARVKAAGPKAFVEAIVLRGAEGRAALADGTVTIPGVRVVRDTLPLAPSRDFARAVLGTVGPVTAEIVKRSGGVYGADDEAGVSGLELRDDEQLRGTPGVRVHAVGAKGTGPDLFTVAPAAGTPLSTTLDPRLQTAAERSLADIGPASALVAVRPSTGDLLAVASGPGSKGYSTATVGQYAPGSTFKVVSSLALLRAGVRPTTTVSCPATTVVDGKRFKNYSDYPAGGLGRIPLSTAVANSCNTAFIGERGVVSQADIAEAGASLGIGVDHDLGFPAYFGSVPATEAAAGSATGHAASMIGQGTVTASPMAMATVAASVAKGSTVVPRLLPGQRTGTSTAATPLTAAEARQLRSLMRGVVTRGSGSFLASLPGAPVLAKTGTAEFGDTAPLRTHAWMIAVHGDLAVAVFVDVGSSGSGTAGPILEQFLRAAG